MYLWARDRSWKLDPTSTRAVRTRFWSKSSGSGLAYPGNPQRAFFRSTTWAVESVMSRSPSLTNSQYLYLSILYITHIRIYISSHTHTHLYTYTCTLTHIRIYTCKRTHLYKKLAWGARLLRARGKRGRKWRQKKKRNLTTPLNPHSAPPLI